MQCNAAQIGKYARKVENGEQKCWMRYLDDIRSCCGCFDRTEYCTFDGTQSHSKSSDM